MTKKHTKCTLPKLSKNKKAWYVYYRYEVKQFRESNGLNKIADLKIREQEYEKLCKDILIELKSDWNPNIPDGVQLHTEMFVVEALQFALDEKKPNIAKKTYSAYYGSMNFIILQDIVGEKSLYQNINLVQLAQVPDNKEGLIQLYDLHQYLDNYESKQNQANKF